MTQLALTPEASQAAAGAVIRAETRNLTVTGPDIQTLLEHVAADMEIVPTMDVDSDDMATEMIQALGRLATVEKAADAERLERGRPLRETQQWLNDGYNPVIKNLQSIIAGGKAKLTAYSRKKQEEARIAREAEEKRKREEAEEAARKEAEALAAAKAAVEKAAELHDAGSEQVAQAMADEAMVAVDMARKNAEQATLALHTRPTFGSYSAPVKGSREVWKGEVTDKAKLIVAIAEEIKAGSLANIALLEVSMPVLNSMAKMQKQHLSLPGVRAVREESVAIRRQAVAA